MYIQPKSEIAEVTTGHALCGSVTISTNDPNPTGPGIGGSAPKRRVEVF